MGWSLRSPTVCSPSNGVVHTTVPVSLGSRLGTSGNYDQQFFGNINDVAVYNYALSSNQVVSAHYGRRHWRAHGHPASRLHQH